MQQFINFVREQGIVGLAVGLAVGVAAKEAVDAIVAGFIDPLVGFIVGGADLSNLTWNTGISRNGNDLIFGWGAVASALLTLLAVAAVVFYFIRTLRLDRLDKKKD